MSLRRYTWRSMQQRPARTILTVLSIVIGVTAAVAVGLGTATTRNAYKAMFALVTGKSTLEIDAKGGGIFSEDVLAKVREVPGVKVAAPVLDRTASMSFGDGRRTRLKVLGIDPAVDHQVRDYRLVAGRDVQEGNEIAIDEGLANYLGMKVGDTVKISGSGGLGTEYTIVGLFQLESGASLAQLGMAMMPLERAKRQFNGRRIPRNSIDKIQIVTEANVDPDSVRPLIAKVLPEEVEVHRPAASTQLMQETLLSSEQGLRLTTIFSLLMAAFIILNTFLMNVSERRRHISIMRAVGATRGQITRSLLGEAMLLGLVGTIVGIGCGVGLAYFATKIIARSFDVQLPRLIEVMTAWPFIQGAVFGMLMAFIGAIVPAVLAGRVSPLEGMNRLIKQPTRSFTVAFLVLGSIQVIAATIVIVGCILGRIPIEAATYAAPLLIIGLVMLDTALLRPQVALAATVLRQFFRVEASLAQKQVLRNRMRSALTVAVLFIAGSTGIGMANSILDNVRNVHDWSRQALTADFYIRSLTPDMATGEAADLPEELGRELKQVAHVSAEETAFVEAKVRQEDQPVEDALTAIAVCRYFKDDAPRFDLIAGRREGLGPRLRRGEIVIGSVLSQKLGVGVGDTLPLETRDGVQQIPIAGVTNDYLVAGLSMYMQWEFSEKWLGPHGVDGYAVNVEKGYMPTVAGPLDALAKKYDVILISQSDIADMIDRFVGGVEWSLWLLVLMGFVVGAFGMVNTLTMNVLEQTRELGLLRIVAMTKRQVHRTILMQALIIGGIGLPPGILIGVAIAYTLNMTMMASFGRLIRFHTYPGLLLGTLIGGILIVVIAAWFPGRRATRINVVEALHYE